MSEKMPTYDYECIKCGHEFEFFQKMTDTPLVRCPRCKGNLRRLIGCGSGIIFRGSGFYATDYKKSPAKSSDKSKEGVTESLSKEDKACPKVEGISTH